MNILYAVAPTPQASVNAFTLVTGSILNASQAISVSFTIKNTGLNSIDWQVIGGQLSDLSDGAVIQAPAALAANAVSSYGVSVAPFKYYGISIKSTVGGSHGQATIRGISKG